MRAIRLTLEPDILAANCTDRVEGLLNAQQHGADNCPVLQCSCTRRSMAIHELHLVTFICRGSSSVRAAMPAPCSSDTATQRTSARPPSSPALHTPHRLSTSHLASCSQQIGFSDDCGKKLQAHSNDPGEAASQMLQALDCHQDLDAALASYGKPSVNFFPKKNIASCQMKYCIPSKELSFGQSIPLPA